ncbi:hypothetical protein BE04_15290 [Sorangium cellulosum]|nr:hypothetical protein [Sorangium cellulosum]KYF46778.1 hypothetical protein BE04_15290 [Sorangium cellulosum]
MAVLSVLGAACGGAGVEAGAAGEAGGGGEASAFDLSAAPVGAACDDDVPCVADAVCAEDPGEGEYLSAWPRTCKRLGPPCAEGACGPAEYCRSLTDVEGNPTQGYCSLRARPGAACHILYEDSCVEGYTCARDDGSRSYRCEQAARSVGSRERGARAL